MEAKDTYLTLAEESTGFFKDKGSKFIAYAKAVHTVEDVKMFIEQVQNEHIKSRHVCYAYRLGLKGELFRANDDGEPSGTAGKPILGQIDSFNLTNIAVLVVRYFGGTKLGTSGLKNAYKTATIDALTQGNKKKFIVTSAYSLIFNYITMNNVMRIIKDYDLEIINRESKEKAHINITIRLDQVEKLSKLFKKIEGLEMTLITLT